jgi:hypothetical protein
MISNVGLWAGVGYLYEDIDQSSTQQGSNYNGNTSTYRLVAGGYSYYTSSDNAVPGYRYAYFDRSITNTYIGARGATADVSD